MLGETKGVNLPGKVIDLPAITKKDAGGFSFHVKDISSHSLFFFFLLVYNNRRYPVWN